MKKMRRRYYAGLLLLTFVFIVRCAGVTAQTGQAPGPVIGSPGPSVIVSPIVAPLDKNTQIVITGSGFDPGQELVIGFEDEYGASAEIKEVKVNERGSWATAWTLGRYTRRGILKDGVYPIIVMDKDLNIIKTAPVAFIKPTGDPKKWPDWAKAAKIKPKGKKK